MTIQLNNTRKGCHDIWNAFMCEGANYSYSKNDIPLCPTTADKLPVAIIPWDEAKRLHRTAIARKDVNYYYDVFVCFYLDDYKFDGTRGIWRDYKNALNVLSHFAGAITPDFSTYQDFPKPLKIYNTYRMRAFGYWLGKNGIAVINNVRWGSKETWDYCWDGIPRNSMIAIGTVGGSPRKIIDRKRFEEGLNELVRVLKPHTILVYGSANYDCFKKLSENGVKVVSYPSHTALAFERRQAK